MRKKRFYFGRNKGYDFFGRKDGKLAVIRPLCKYFRYRWQLSMLEQGNKFLANSSFGATGDVRVADKFYANLLEERKKVKAKMMSGSF